MLSCTSFFQLLINQGIRFFTGVPDSQLKEFCACISDKTENDRHVIAANEGSAIALAAGYYLATGNIGLVYLQNSGLGNAVNPLTSLVDPEVYGIPVLMLIGWRGEPGVKDEPQHAKQGRITLELLNTLEIEHAVLPHSFTDAEYLIKRAVDYMQTNNRPFGLVVRKDTFEPYNMKKENQNSYLLSREQAIIHVLSKIGPECVTVSTTGKISRELFEYRNHSKANHGRDFLTVGSMGHASQIALGIALARSDKKVYCLDGDGAFIMHMGSVAINGFMAPVNFRHIVFNNGAHDSVGGQPTAGFFIDMPSIARACGYINVFRVETEEELLNCLDQLDALQGPSFLEIRVKCGSRKDLGRPTSPPQENKQAFMSFLRKDLFQ